jgi:hypothetical protein
MSVRRISFLFGIQQPTMVYQATGYFVYKVASRSVVCGTVSATDFFFSFTSSLLCSIFISFVSYILSPLFFQFCFTLLLVSFSFSLPVSHFFLLFFLVYLLTFRSRKLRLTAVGIGCADHATPSTCKSWH